MMEQVLKPYLAWTVENERKRELNIEANNELMKILERKDDQEESSSTTNQDGTKQS